MFPGTLDTCTPADTCAHTTTLSLSLFALVPQAAGSSPCRWKCAQDTKNPPECKVPASFWENTPQCKALLLLPAASPWQRWRAHEVPESESQGYSIYSCVNNTTPLWKEYYIPCKNDENTYLIFPASVAVHWTWRTCTAIKVKTRKWTARISVSLRETQVEEAWFQTVTLAHYFWPGLFKWDKIGQNYQCVFSSE